MRNILKKIGNFIKDKKLYILTFVSATIVIGVLYVSNDVTPFGKKSLLCVDFYHQYGPMLGELYDRIVHGENMTYSFTMAMGLPFFRNFLNYMSSPFNIIILFFSRDNLVTSYSFIIGLKAIFSACTFVYFISHKFKTKDLSIIPLGLIYAFSAYYSAYYWNIMWLDSMVFLPLIVLGIEYIVKEGKWKFYTVFLSIMLIANYFVGYMICIFSVLYFIVFNIHEFSIEKGKTKQNIKKFFKNCLLFGIGSLTAGLISSVFLLPMAYSMKSISATGGTFPKVQYYTFQLEDFLKYHFTAVPTTTFASDELHAPNVSAGILGVGLLLLFIVNLEIPKKTKIAYLFMLCFILFAFFDPKLDFILHAFHVPNDLPFRYSFLYIFVLVTIGSYALINMKKMKYPLIVSCYIFLMVLLLLIRGEQWQGMTNNIIYINVILLSLYFIFYSGQRFIKDLRTPFVIALAITATIDCTASISHNWDITQVLATFYEDYNSTEELLNYVDNYDGTNFYRIENIRMMTYNDPSWYSYNGITTFSSMAYESMAELQHNLGLPGNNINSYAYVQSTPIYDLMFDVKYFIGITNDKVRYTPIKTIDETANQFNYNVGLGFSVKDSLKDWNYQSLNPFYIQNDFMKLATGVDNILEPMKPDFITELYDESDKYIVRYEYKNPNDNMYFYTDDYNVSFFIIGNCLYDKRDDYVNYGENENVYYSMVENYNEPKVINIASQDETVYIDVAYDYCTTNTSSIQVYTINQNKFEEAYNILMKNKLYINEFKDSYIKAFISTSNVHVYTSIPYDEGWEVYVDGEKTNKILIGDALLGFDVEPGNHTVEFKFRPKGQTAGIIGTIIGFLILFSNKIYALIKNKNKKKKKVLHK